MGNVIQTNVASIGIQRALNKTSTSLTNNFQRLSTGLRINSAKDDAAGLQISNKLTTQISGLEVATRNANDGISLTQTAEGALQESTNLLQRIRDLSIQSANGSNSNNERAALQAEVSQLIQEVNRISETTRFGSLKLLDGSFGHASFQVGSNANETIDFTIARSSAQTLGTHRVELESLVGTSGLGGLNMSSGPPPNGVPDSTLEISGHRSATVNITSRSSAHRVQDFVNAETETTGVSADARTILRLHTLSDAGSVAFILASDTGNSTSQVNISTTISDTSDLTTLADAINQESSETAITAMLVEGGTAIDLISEVGDDINLWNYNHTANGDFDVDVRNFSNTSSLQSIDFGTSVFNENIRAVGVVRLSSSNTYSVTASSLSLNDVTTAETSTSSNVSDINISTISGSQDAIDVVDGAIAAIGSTRAELGAIQNRMSSTVANLGSIIENVSAARSRIRDTDFASETAKLAKSQVLQEASLSILAQANASRESVLSLLL